MSRGISIYYRIKFRDEYGVTYNYSGVDQAEEYDDIDFLAYDGEFYVGFKALECSSEIEALRNNSVKIVCKSRRDHFMIKDEEKECYYPYFALKAISKIFRRYKKEGSRIDKDCVVF